VVGWPTVKAMVKDYLGFYFWVRKFIFS